MNKDFFEILRKLEKNPILTQREIAKELNFSLGKINYCLQELKKKGLIKISNFSKLNTFMF
jgi:DNA-binding Lrp family transcriptional regulator